MNSTPQIFKERLIKNRLAHFTRDNVPDFDARFKEVGLWCNATAEKHLDRTKETNVQGAFMTRLFNQVFGYAEIIDNAECYNQEREFKTVLDTTESDGALGFFNKTAGTRDVRVVIELKDARTSLDKKQNRSSHLTPVEQAFSYANKNGSKCGWVIVSNFVEIRLYKSNSSLEYETFDMRKMKDEKEFLRLYYFLCKDHLIAESGKSVIDVLHIFSDTPVNEAHVKDAIRRHFLHEKDNIRFLSKIETYKMHALGILGTLFLSASYLLSHYTEGVFVEILTIIGWVAIWEAAGGVILRRPELYHFRKKYDFALKTEIIIDVLPRD